MTATAGKVTVLVAGHMSRSFGHGQRPWDAVVDAIGHKYPGQAISIDWDAGECDKWTATSGHVYVGPKMAKLVGRWERIAS
ncbi:MAG: hypothetical protein OXG44_09190 [Gammaproteobacteria bacterium]|nr:hypothetical protein [Gammaproteobacteria bacterium]